jgi:hypothetical protein
MRGRDTFGDSIDRWSRSDWWGVVLDAPDAPSLAHFYSALLLDERNPGSYHAYHI